MFVARGFLDMSYLMMIIVAIVTGAIILAFAASKWGI